MSHPSKKYNLAVPLQDMERPEGPGGSLDTAKVIMLFLLCPRLVWFKSNLQEMEDQGSPPRNWFGSWCHQGEPMKLLTRYSGGTQAEEANTALIQASFLAILEPLRSYLDFHHVVLPCLPAHANSNLHPLCHLGNWHFYAIFYAWGTRICSRRQSLTKKCSDVSPSALQSLHIQKRRQSSQNQLTLLQSL